MTKTVRAVSGIQQGVQLDMANPTGVKQSQIIQALTSQSKGDSMEILAKYAGLQYIKKYNLLLREDHQVTVSEVLRFYGVLPNTIRCPYCMDSMSMDLIFLHLEHKFKKGHSFTHKQVIQFFLDEESGKNSDLFKENNLRPR